MANASMPPIMPSIKSRAAALDQLRAFAPKAGREYQAKRNFDFGPEQHTSVSGLSAYIRHRVISETEVLRAVLCLHTPAQADKFIQEVFWRTYWKGWLEHRPAVWRNYLQQLAAANLAVEKDSRSGEIDRRAIEGETGIEPFDAWVKELVTTGYLHNHSRMWFASVWIFTLQLPWVLGADFFLRHLLDGDPASNTLSWRWVAGLHTKGKTYLATAGNIEKYAANRFFTGGAPAGIETLAVQAVPVEEPALLPARAPQLSQPPLSGAASGLLLSEDDLHLDVPGKPVSVAVWMAQTPNSPQVSDLVRSFKSAVAQDALDRALQKWPDATSGKNLIEIADIVAWVQSEKLEHVYAAYIPVGPLGVQCASLERALTNVGCQLHLATRDYDKISWPYTSRGYFKLRKQIPELLQSLNLL